MPLLDLLQVLAANLHITSSVDGLIDPGTTIRLQLPIDLSMLRVPSIEQGDVALDFLAKNVLFADDSMPTAQQGQSPLAALSNYISDSKNVLAGMPPPVGITTTDVPGFVGQAAGAIPMVVERPVQLTINWRVVSGAIQPPGVQQPPPVQPTGGRHGIIPPITRPPGGEFTTGHTPPPPAVPGTDFLAPRGLTGPEVEFIFLPKFVELTNQTLLPVDAYSIFADVTLTALGDQVGPITLGPIPVLVPQIGVPTVAAFFRHSYYRPLSSNTPGWVFVLVPMDSPFRGLSDLMPALTKIQTTLGNLRSVVSIASFLLGLSTLTNAIDGAPALQFAADSEIDDLENIVFQQGHWYNFEIFGSVTDYDADDAICSMILLGAPGQEVSIFTDSSLGGDGVAIETGADMWAALDSLNWSKESDGKALLRPASALMGVNGQPDTFASKASSITF
jgi:hypothetical protein